ncbi:MAG: hypothetical protein D6722_01310, partial [Bacteroidetes bacterium]
MTAAILAFFSLANHPAAFLALAFSWDKLAKYASIGLVASVKFVIGVVVAIGTPGFTFWDILISAAGGAWLGAIVFIFFGAQIRRWLKKRFNIGKPMSFA